MRLSHRQTRERCMNREKIAGGANVVGTNDGCPVGDRNVVGRQRSEQPLGWGNAAKYPAKKGFPGSTHQ